MTVLRRRGASLLPRRPMARPVGSALAPRATDPTGPAGPLGKLLATLAAGTPLAGILARLDTWRARRPLVFWAVAATLVVGCAAAVVGGATRFGAAGSGSTARSALDAFTTGAPATTGASGATAADAGGPASTLLGGSIDPVDLVVKGGLVIVLLFVTLRVLRRVQGGGVPADARIRLIESRTIGAKTQLHLVAIGDRHVLIGATPGRLVTLAELSGDDIESPLPFAARIASVVPAGRLAAAGAIVPGDLAEADSTDTEPGASFAAALDLARAGAGR